MWIVFIPLSVVATVMITVLAFARLRARREAFIRHYAFPRGLFNKLRERRPELGERDVQLIAQGLRQFFLAHLRSGRRWVSMPSLVADELWHEFILYTRHYDAFCREAFGRFFHHTPATVLGSDRRDNSGLRRVWTQCCREENIHPDRPLRLPLLFALDTKFSIAGGYRYSLDCRGRAAQDGATWCAGDFASGPGDGEGGFSFDGDSGCAGDGGGGCGGGD